jgi:hypothetical protein
MGSNPTQGMDVCPHPVVLFCIGRGLAMGQPLVQGVLPTVEKTVPKHRIRRHPRFSMKI